MLYSNDNKRRRNQLQADAPDVYISAILNPIIGIGNTTCLTLLTHLHGTYITITEAELDKNQDRMKIQWNPPTSIEILFTHINNGVVFIMAGGDAPRGPSIIRITYNIVAVTGRFDIAAREWWANTATNKTWAVFQTHFKAADSDNMLIKTAGATGYHGASDLTTTLANTQAALVASDLALQAHITPSITSSSNLSAITPATGPLTARTMDTQYHNQPCPHQLHMQQQGHWPSR
jgi:hypothetical protein